MEARIMNKRTFSVCGYPIQISGIESIAKQYRQFPSCKKNPILSLDRTTKNVTLDRKLGGAKNHFGRSDDLFVIKDHAGTIFINSDWSKISIKGDVLKSTLINLLECEIRRQAIKENLGMIHASGVQYNGSVFLFPAWRHTGKTNTMLTLLENGGQYLSDDRLFVDSDGYCYSFPTPLRLYQYNLRAFPDLTSGKASSIRSELSYQVAKITKDMSKENFFRRVLDFGNNTFIKQKVTLYANQFATDFDYSKRLSVDQAIFLETTQNQNKALISEPLSSEDAARMLVSISNYEWNLPLEKIYSAYDLLFPERQSRIQVLEEIREKEKSVIDSFVDKTDCHLLPVPEEAQWPTDTKRSIHRLLLNLN